MYSIAVFIKIIFLFNQMIIEIDTHIKLINIKKTHKVVLVRNNIQK